jgi:hypothetical protein
VTGWARRWTPAVFLLLSLTTFSGLLDGNLSLDVAALRCLVALLVTYFGLQLLETLVSSYTVEPEPDVAEPAETAVDEEPAPARRADDADQAA